MATAKKLPQHVRSNERDLSYDLIRSINGPHPLQDIQGSCVLYRARKRKHGRVIYFNFNLAKEMGLIDLDHPHRITPELSRAILDTFSLQIINEYDVLHDLKIRDQELKPHPYMATRYLQLQHPDRRGLRSGDGRSIWNGFFDNGREIWDISSCGTGATSLSPASVRNQTFYQSGDPSISYGCGYSEALEGIGDAIFSEIFYRNGIPTERSLAVITFDGELSINVRAAKNLLRPSHFFNHLKQGHRQRLQQITDYCIERQLRNKVLSRKDVQKDRYGAFLNYIAKTFAHISALFESEYIFCWLDWDGDNILIDGGIIDYGSIRQFGLFHYKYRYDDIERYSTTLVEQKHKARYIVQCFAQAIDFIKTGRKKPLEKFAKHQAVRHFNRTFHQELLKRFLYRCGFTRSQSEILLQKHRKIIQRMFQSFRYFERTTSQEGPIQIEDGITHNAVYCMRDILREFPLYYIENKCLLTCHDFLKIIQSQFSDEKALVTTPTRDHHAQTFQQCFVNLVERLKTLEQKASSDPIWQQLAQRSQQINRAARITGDAAIHVSHEILDRIHQLSSNEIQKVIEDFITKQDLNPDWSPKHAHSSHDRKSYNRTSTQKLVDAMLKLVKEYREGL